jgi:hypothetical protein
MILILTRVADGFTVTSWSVTLATSPLISTRFAGGLLNYVLEQFLLRLATKKKGVLTESFIFTTDNAKRVVAKLPFTPAGPPRLTTNSEVATMKYCEFKPIDATVE